MNVTAAVLPVRAGQLALLKLPSLLCICSALPLSPYLHFKLFIFQIPHLIIMSWLTPIPLLCHRYICPSYKNTETSNKFSIKNNHRGATYNNFCSRPSKLRRWAWCGLQQGSFATHLTLHLFPPLWRVADWTWQWPGALRSLKPTWEPQLVTWCLNPTPITKGTLWSFAVLFPNLLSKPYVFTEAAA